MNKIGVVGLGIMGSGMANNFLKKGYQVYVWNRSKNKAETLEKDRAIKCVSPAEVVEKSDIVFEVTANDESSKAVWRGKGGILAGAKTGKVLVVSATISIGWVDELKEKCNKLGVTFFDMALTGGRIGAESGNLTLLCGGNEEDLNKIKPVLEAIATKTYLFGPQGSGMRYKLILNFVQAVHIVAFGQAMKMAKMLGMDLNKVGNALVERPGGTTTTFSWRDFQKEPNPINFSVEWITKDLKYFKKMTKNMEVKLLREVLGEYEKAIKKGNAQKDWTSINILENL